MSAKYVIFKPRERERNFLVSVLFMTMRMLFFVVLLIGFAILTKGVSIRLSNLKSLLISTASTGLMAIGMTLVIIDRGIDLSVGGVAALSSAIGVLKRICR